MFTVVYRFQPQKLFNIVNVQVIGHFISIHWTHEQELRFLIRFTAVVNEANLIHCIHGQLDEKSVLNKILHLEKKIFKYTTLIPLQRNVNSYILDIGINDIRKEATRYYVRIPKNLDSKSPVVVVTPYQTWAEFTVFEQSKSGDVKHYYSIAECSSKDNWTHESGEDRNWKNTDCDVNRSVTSDQQMKPGVPVSLHLEERHAYQIWIDSVDNSQDYDLLKSPVFGRPEQGLRLERIGSDDFSGQVPVNTESESDAGRQLSSQVAKSDDAARTDAPSDSLIVIVTVGSAVVTSLAIAVAIIKHKRGVNPGECAQQCVLMRFQHKSELRNSLNPSDQLYDVKNRNSLYDAKQEDDFCGAKYGNSYCEAEHGLCDISSGVSHDILHDTETMPYLLVAQSSIELSPEPSESIAPLYGNLSYTDNFKDYIKLISQANRCHSSDVIYNSTNTASILDQDLNALTRSVSQQFHPKTDKHEDCFVRITKDSVIVQLPRKCMYKINAQVLEKATNTSRDSSSFELISNASWAITAPTAVDENLTWTEIEEQLSAINET
ncbi:hypothetical protein Btru_029354 [Bulinus truncatus]|nr:hypothetical protein Btru_029354 [Bulinus truncatus]